MHINRPTVISYQLITGLVETALGVWMVAAPESALNQLLRAPAASLPFVSLAGMFVFTLGMCGLLGACMVSRREGLFRLQAIWLVASILHSASAIFIGMQVVTHIMAMGWFLIAVLFGSFALSEAFLVKWSTAAPSTHLSKPSMCRGRLAKTRTESRRWIQ